MKAWIRSQIHRPLCPFNKNSSDFRKINTSTIARLDSDTQQQRIKGAAERYSSRQVYRFILIQLFYLPDQHAARVIHDLVISAYRLDPPASFAPAYRRARHCLRILEKANLGDPDALQTVVEYAYGQRGRLRHRYLAPLLAQNTPEDDRPPELLPGVRRTRPPVITPQLMALFKAQPTVAKRLDLTLPVPRAGPFGPALHPRREANARWRHYVLLVSRTLPPLPPAHFQVLRDIALGFPGRLSIGAENVEEEEKGKVGLVVVPLWRTFTRLRMNEQMRKKTTSPHHVTHRFLRRLYLRILAKSPILRQSPDGSWNVSFYSVPSAQKTQAEHPEESKELKERQRYLFAEIEDTNTTHPSNIIHSSTLST